MGRLRLWNGRSHLTRLSGVSTGAVDGAVGLLHCCDRDDIEKLFFNAESAKSEWSFKKIELVISRLRLNWHQVVPDPTNPFLS